MHPDSIQSLASAGDFSCLSSSALSLGASWKALLSAVVLVGLNDFSVGIDGVAFSRLES